MEEESFIGAFGDVPTDFAGEVSQLYMFRVDDFGEWYRRVRDAHEREVDALRDSMAEPDWDDQAALDHLTDADLAEHGLVRLPVDAGGVPIHVGDVMEWYDSGETLTVEGIGRDVLFYIDGENAEWTAARDKRHHHAPTVEDVLREFAKGLGVPVADSYVAAAAAKLRLAEGVE